MHILKKNKSFLYYSISFALIFAIIHSIHWILPYIQFKEDFLPIFHSSILSWDRGGDDYFYYTFINDITNGNLIYNDPVNKDYSNIYSIYNSFNLSLALASFSGIFFDNISNIYSFNYFVFPFLNFIITCLFLKLFFRSTTIIILITFLTFYLSPSPDALMAIIEVLKYFVFGLPIDFLNVDLVKDFNQFYRLPTNLITNMHLLISIYIVYCFFEVDRKKYKTLTGLFLASSIFFSISNFLVITVFFAIYFLNYMKLKSYKEQLYEIVFFIILMTPSMIFISENFLKLDLIQDLIFEREKHNSIENTGKDKSYNLIKNINLYFFLVILFLINQFLVKVDRKKLIQIFLVSNFILIFPLSIIFGDEYTYRLYNRGSEIILTLFAFILIIKFITQIVINKINIIKIKYFKIIAYSFVILLNVYTILYETNKQQFNNHYNLNFSNLLKWININTRSNDVVVTIDPELIYNLPIYTNVDTYLTHTILSRSNLIQRSKRAVNVFKFYGNSNDDIYNFVINQNFINSKDKFLYETLFTFDAKINEKIVNDNAFKNFIASELNDEKNHDLLFRSRYVILSKYDMQHVKPNSSLMKVLKNKLKIYENDEYSVFQLL